MLVFLPQRHTVRNIVCIVSNHLFCFSLLAALGNGVASAAAYQQRACNKLMIQKQEPYALVSLLLIYLNS